MGLRLEIFCKACEKELQIHEVRELGTDIKIVVDTCECGDKKMCNACTKYNENQYTQTIDELNAQLDVVREAVKDKKDEKPKSET